MIQPQTYTLFSASRAFILDTETDSKEGIFVYKYDRKGQQIQKRVPGNTDFEVMVYDRLYRMVLSRDAGDDQVLDAFGRSRFKFTKFDALDRPVMSGLTFLTQGYNRQTLQDDFDNHPANQINETRVNTGGLLGYSNTSFPSNYTPQDANVRAVNYFDNYTWQLDNLYNFDATKAFGTRWTNSYFGMATGSLERNVDNLDWYRTVNYFDFKGRAIQAAAQNHVGGIDRLNLKYSFTGEILKALKTTDKGTTATKITELSEYTYNHVGLKTSFTHNGLVVAKYDYDAINRLQIKKFKPSGTFQGSKQTGNWTDVNTWLSGVFPLTNDNVTINTGHTVTIPSGLSGSAGVLNDKGILKNFGTLNMGKYSTADLYNQSLSYHIRGGLRGINLDANSNLTSALFSMKLSYEDDGTYFDGNIRKQEWKSNFDNVTRSFTYRYDGSSRIKAGVYSGKTGENYTLGNVTYDNNGNITNILRNGLRANNSFGIIDNLNYTYNTNSNKLLKVDDSSNETASFKDVSGNDYTYWADGSLKSDANKGITLIEYNYLKRPKKYTFSNNSTLENQYDASGKKLKETIGTTTTDYVGNTIYKNNVLYQITHDEGRIVNGIYEYNITDNLGNLRVAFKDSLGIAKIVQSNAYGVWGEDLPTLKYLNTPKTNNFGYLNREFQPATGYTDLVNRQFDNIIGRFTSQDPVIEGQEDLSLYQYGWNNPVLRSDANGLMPDGGGGGGDPNSEFFLANLLTTAFYDVKHAIFNTAARAVSSDFRASYARGSDGQEVFETKYAKQARPTSIGGQLKEVASGALDVMVVSGVRAGPAGIGVLAESSETQTVRGVKGVSESISTAYKRPSGSVTPQQRASVQGKPCVDCGSTPTKMVADHKKPLVQEYYETGTIDKKKMRSVDAVQPQCPTCSAKQGAEMSKYSKQQKKALGL